MRPKLIGVRASELVILAIHNLEGTTRREFGFTQEDITKYLADKYDLNHGRIKPQIKSALERGLMFGILSHNSGRYRLEEVPEPPLSYRGQNAAEAGASTAKRRKNSERQKRARTKGKANGKAMRKACCRRSTRSRSRSRYDAASRDSLTDSSTDENKWMLESDKATSESD